MEKVTQKTISDFARRIAEQFNPGKIILFGSYAYGKPTADSDVDMLVIMSFEGRGAYKSAEIATTIKPDFPVDILVRTPEQIKQRLNLGDFFIREIMERGKVLYEA
jgi:predicted nucleotidyltransferase